MVGALRDAGLRVLATTVDGEVDLDDAELAGPTAWLFGPEAHGLPAEVAAMADSSGPHPDAGHRREPQRGIGRIDLPVPERPSAPTVTSGRSKRRKNSRHGVTFAA